MSTSKSKSTAKSKANPQREQIPLTGRVFVSGALADIYPSREVPSNSRLQAGDLKLWCHKFQNGNPVGSGIFRAAVFDGRSFRTFRLNIIADADARYGDYNDWKNKAARTIKAMSDQKARPAHWRNNTYGVVFTIRAEVPPPVNQPKPAVTSPVTQLPEATVETPVVTEAARQSTPPAIARDTTATGTGEKSASTPVAKPVTAKRRGRKRFVDERQLTMF